MSDESAERAGTEAAPDASGRDDAVMLGALGIPAYVASMMTHEALGHGAFCVAAGGHNLMLTGWAEECNLEPLPSAVTAAGPAVQFGAGLLAWAALRRIPAGLVVQRSFVWLYMVFNLFISSGYVAFSGVTGFGDSAVLISGLSPPWLWRTLLVAVGAVVYYLSMWAAPRELRRMPGRSSDRRLRRFFLDSVSSGRFACVLRWRAQQDDGARHRAWIGSREFPRRWLWHAVFTCATTPRGNEHAVAWIVHQTERRVACRGHCCRRNLCACARPQ